MSPLAHRSALVTGSTSGIGLAIAQALAWTEPRVMLNGLGNSAEIERTRAALAEPTDSEIRFNGPTSASRPRWRPSWPRRRRRSGPSTSS